MALSEDLRRRIVDLVATGVSRRKAARHFQVSISSAIRFVKQNQENGTVAPKKRKPRESKIDPFSDELLEWITKQPDLTLQELSEKFAHKHSLRVPISTLADWLRNNNISYKKNGTRHGTRSC